MIDRGTLLPLAALLGAVSCAPQGPGIAFNSAEEQACYERADAALTSPNQSLERDGNGVFVIVTKTSGFVRGISPSEVFESCIAEATGIGPLTERRTITFTPDEAEAWSRLTDAEKSAAYDFILTGGTLADYLATLG